MPENPLAAVTALDPQFMGEMKKVEALVYGDGALPAKIKYLMAMAFDAAHGAVEGVRWLAGAAMRAGATREEIAETLRVAAHLEGVGTLYAASAGLKEIVEGRPR
jgi:alkylhydroperoxidase/carboxymuconolactone decarboxylase family protein YurZ